MKRFLGFAVFFLSAFVSFSQSWTSVNQNNIPARGQKDIVPTKGLYFQINDEEFKSLLWKAPHESEGDVLVIGKDISFPIADGSFETFKVVRYDMMEEGLANKYPDIKTFHGISTKDNHNTIKIDYTEQGVRAMVMSEYGFTYIDHYQRGDKAHRVVYYKKDYIKEGSWACEFDSELHGNDVRDTKKGENRVGDCIFRTYRLAQATTGEYSNHFGATSSTQASLVLSAVTTTINRVVGVMEKDFATRLLLVNNTDLVFFYDAASDPYNTSSASSMLGDNQTQCDTKIGNVNYDMGHVFFKAIPPVGSNGVAYLDAVCNNSTKAGGVTGHTTPSGDPFDIDYVIHEMGHQFGANHTQYNNCNRNNSTAMEPGSASSIMGYAGICSPNVQNNSDSYFHAISIGEIKTKLPNKNCNGTITFVNNAPSVTSVTSRSIPISTPFIITTSATDLENDPMLFCWEQMNAYSNPTQTMPPMSTNSSGPIFRSLSPLSQSFRYFPPLADIVAGSTNTWEVLPSVARTLSFRITVRDYHNIAGCTSEQNMTVTTVTNSTNGSGAIGIFTVTSQGAASTWEVNSSQTITWNVNNTTAPPVNCANVDILLSTDGGLTFPVTLLANTPNDGSQNITVPNNLTTNGRIMVKGSNHIFYDLNGTNATNGKITIVASQASFDLTVNPVSQALCNTGSATTTVSIAPVSGFTGNVTLSVSSLPAGMVANFSTNPVPAGGSSILTISNLTGYSGTQIITINAVSGSINRSKTFTIVLDAPLNGPTLTGPTNGATGVNVLPSLYWDPIPNVSVYLYEISRSNTFTFLTASGQTNETSYTFEDGLEGSSTYFWRVKATNLCSNNAWSSPNSFTTEGCIYLKPLDLPKTISSGLPNEITSIISVPYRGLINTLEVLNLEGNHSDVSQLQFLISKPIGPDSTLIWDHPCTTGTAGFDINLSNLGLNPPYPCPPTNGRTYKPSNVINYSNADLYGKWKLKVKDLVNGSGGNLNKWEAKMCYSSACRLEVNHPYNSGMGSLNEAVNCALAGDTITFSATMQNLQIDLGTNNLIIDKNIVIKANPSLNITIVSSASNSTLEILSGVTTTIEGLIIKSSFSSNGAITNNGICTLKDVTCLKNNSFPLVKNLTNNNQMIFLGNCIMDN